MGIIQTPAAATYGPGTSVAKTFASACTPGSTLVAVMTGENKRTLSVTDSAGQSWAADIANGTNAATFCGAAIFSCVNASSSALTVTGNASGTDYGSLKIFELDAGATIDKVGFIVGNETPSHDSNTAAPSITLAGCAANCVILGAMAGYNSGGGTWGPDSGYTLGLARVALSNTYHAQEHIADAGASGSKTLNWNGVGAPNAYMAFVAAAYKPSGGGGGGSGMVGVRNSRRYPTIGMHHG